MVHLVQGPSQPFLPPFSSGIYPVFLCGFKCQACSGKIQLLKRSTFCLVESPCSMVPRFPTYKSCLLLLKGAMFAGYINLYFQFCCFNPSTVVTCRFCFLYQGKFMRAASPWSMSFEHWNIGIQHEMLDSASHSSHPVFFHNLKCW